MSNNPLNIVAHRETFQERALRDLTTPNANNDAALDPSNPVLIREETDAQKDYLRRLKFTYLEQEAKRNFLFSITGEEPQGVLPGENEALEKSNELKKRALKGLKTEVEEMREEAIALARENAASEFYLGCCLSAAY